MSVVDIEALIAYRCAECEVVSEEASDEKLYECGECNRKASGADGRRCEDCRKFCQKLADQCCIECNAGEVEEVAAFRCNKCSEIIEGGETLSDHVMGGFNQRFADRALDCQEDLAEHFLKGDCEEWNEGANDLIDTDVNEAEKALAESTKKSERGKTGGKTRASRRAFKKELTESVSPPAEKTS